MKALETYIFGLRLNDLSANDVLLAAEFMNGMPWPIDRVKDEARHAEIAKYLINLAKTKKVA